MTRVLPVWRSMLFVPAINEKLVESATRRSPDAFQIDLEDAVPIERKAEARDAVQGIARRLVGRGSDVLVRINHPWRLAVRDLEASVCREVDGLNLPKVGSADQVRAIDEVVSELEAERGLPAGHIRLLAMIETAEGLTRVDEIASACDRLVAITIGCEDLSLDLGMEPNEDALYFPSMALLAAARAAGILPIGYLASVAQFQDRDQFRAVVRRSRRLGFAGGFAIHPRQVDILDEEFSPAPDELLFARELIEAYEQAIERGLGAVTFRGKMIDVPVAERARAVLAQADAIARRTALRQAALPVQG
jgi:citrate lyase subunit beta/citryl-CoA lyase